MEKNHKGLRYNEGKLRYDLVEPRAHEDMVRVLTFGATKYAERNWGNGMSWSNVIASLKRHIAAIEKGEDIDPESGLLHAAHVACNAHFLNAYYYLYPEGDNRPVRWKKHKRISLDIDGVLCDFTRGFHAQLLAHHILKEPHIDYEHFRTHLRWNMEYNLSDVWNSLTDDFWLNLPVFPDMIPLPFDPICYVTARSLSDPMITAQWLRKHNFPASPLYHVPRGESKVDVIKSANVDYFIDDNIDNFIELNKAGITTFLYSQPWNKHLDVGHLRIYSLHDMLKYI